MLFELRMVCNVSAQNRLPFIDRSLHTNDLIYILKPQKNIPQLLQRWDTAFIFLNSAAINWSSDCGFLATAKNQHKEQVYNAQQLYYKICGNTF